MIIRIYTKIIEILAVILTGSIIVAIGIAISEKFGIREIGTNFSLVFGAIYIIYCIVPDKNTNIKSANHRQVSPNSDQTHIISCPICNQKIRVVLPTDGRRLRCVQCSSTFKVQLDSSGILKINDISEKNQYSQSSERTPSLDSFYHALGIESSAKPDEVRDAYKRKINEYHPDKVAKLGDKLKALAEEESKIINLSYSTLKAKGRAS